MRKYTADEVEGIYHQWFRDIANGKVVPFGVYLRKHESEHHEQEPLTPPPIEELDADDFVSFFDHESQQWLFALSQDGMNKLLARFSRKELCPQSPNLSNNQRNESA